MASPAAAASSASAPPEEAPNRWADPPASLISASMSSISRSDERRVLRTVVEPASHQDDRRTGSGALVGDRRAVFRHHTGHAGSSVGPRRRTLGAAGGPRTGL